MKLFLEGVGEGVAGGDEGAPTAAGGVEGDLGGNLDFAHKAVFVEDLDGEIDLGLGGGRSREKSRGTVDGRGSQVSGVVWLGMERGGGVLGNQGIGERRVWGRKTCRGLSPINPTKWLTTFWRGEKCCKEDKIIRQD